MHSATLPRNYKISALAGERRQDSSFHRSLPANQTGTLPRNWQPVSRIPIPPPNPQGGGLPRRHKPLPLSMIFRLQNAFWESGVAGSKLGLPQGPAGLPLLRSLQKQLLQPLFAPAQLPLWTMQPGSEGKRQRAGEGSWKGFLAPEPEAPLLVSAGPPTAWWASQRWGKGRVSPPFSVPSWAPGAALSRFGQSLSSERVDVQMLLLKGPCATCRVPFCLLASPSLGNGASRAVAATPAERIIPIVLTVGEAEPELEGLLPGSEPAEMDDLARPLSPTRLQPVLPPEAQKVPEFEEVARVLAEMPRPLKRRGSMEQNPSPALLPPHKKQYQQIISRLFHHQPRKEGAAPAGDPPPQADPPPVSEATEQKAAAATPATSPTLTPLPAAESPAALTPLPSPVSGGVESPAAVCPAAWSWEAFVPHE